MKGHDFGLKSAVSRKYRSMLDHMGLPVSFGKMLPAGRHMRGWLNEGLFERCLLFAQIHTSWLRSLRRRCSRQRDFIARHGLRLVGNPVRAGHLLLQGLAWLVRAWRCHYHTAAPRQLSSKGCSSGGPWVQVVIWTGASARGADASTAI